MPRNHIVLGLFMTLSALVGCDASEKAEPPAPAPEKPKEAPKPVEGKRTPVNQEKTLFLEVLPDGRRRVVLEAAVCLREGPLEQLMCRKHTKEHEAILHTPVNAEEIHRLLVVAKAAPGAPVKYQPEFKAASGTTIKIWLEYQDKGEKKVVDAKEWIRNVKTMKPLHIDWVFAGSRFFQDPEDPKKKPIYTANGGDVICVSNFPDAMLDLPINSPKDNSDLAFEAWTDRIPARDTKVMVVLEPVLEEKKDKK
jgi:hypothetical protein